MSDDGLAGLRLLVVEDDGMVRDVVVRTARQHGLDVDEADGGMPATALLASNHYDVVITDLKMPGVSGLEVLERVRTRQRTALIVITGFADDGVEDVVAAAGGLLLHKPFNMERLLDALLWAKERVQEQPGSG